MMSPKQSDYVKKKKNLNFLTGKKKFANFIFFFKNSNMNQNAFGSPTQKKKL